jgi:DNA-directed RNA polymerase subunit alpha
MIDPKEISVKKDKETKKSGRFVIEPLPAGYGYTLGSGLRRVLLSSLPGAAIAEVSFEGVSHPFSTIEGVKEDVIELVLNLKKVRFVMPGDEPLEGKITAKGKKEVKAGDIKLPSGAKVANPELKIATLADKSAKVSARVLVEKGVGYRPSEGRKGSRVGVILMDSIFSPVTRVSYQVEEARRGRETGLDKLLIEIDTDETISPSEALKEAVRIFGSYLEPLSGKKKKEAASKKPSSAKKEDKEPSDKVKKMVIEELNLSPQTVTILTREGVKTVAGLLKKTEEDLLSIRGFGAQRVSEIAKELKKEGAALKEGKTSSEEG